MSKIFYQITVLKEQAPLYCTLAQNRHYSSLALRIIAKNGMNAVWTFGKINHKNSKCCVQILVIYGNLGSVIVFP